jgi:crotonobetainyl-CoA:carnitine CoA-transferase CaiB-like acyl-CoA transferase
MGADVVKVEPPGGEPVRSRAPVHEGRSRYFGQLNAGKRSVVLDLSDEPGRGVARALVGEADVLVENFRPGVMTRLGLGPAACRALNPGLVYCSLSGYGRDAQRPAVAPVVHAESGYDLAVAGYQPDGAPPPATGVFVADILGGALAVGGILAALRRRDSTGEGSDVDIALTDAMLSVLVEEVQTAQSGTPTAPPYRPARTNDGFVMVGAFSPRHALALADLIDRPDIAQDPRFAGSGMRAHLDDLHEAVERWTAARSSDEAESAIRAAGVPCSRYRTVDEVLGDEALHARGTLRQARDAVGAFTIVGSPIRFADADGLQSPPPDAFEVHELGTHTRDVLASLAGYDQRRIDDLIERGAAVPSQDEAPAAATTSKQRKELP